LKNRETLENKRLNKKEWKEGGKEHICAVCGGKESPKLQPTKPEQADACQPNMPGFGMEPQKGHGFFGDIQ